MHCSNIDIGLMIQLKEIKFKIKPINIVSKYLFKQNIKVSIRFVLLILHTLVT